MGRSMVRKYVLLSLIIALMVTCTACTNPKVHQLSEGELQSFVIMNTPEFNNQYNKKTCTNGVDYFYISDSDKVIEKLDDDSFDPQIDPDKRDLISSMAVTENYLYYVITEDSKSTLSSVNLKTDEKNIYDNEILNGKTFEINAYKNQLFLSISKENLLYTFEEKATDQSEWVLLNTFLKESGDPAGNDLYVAHFHNELIYGRNDGKVRFITDENKTKKIYENPNEDTNILVVNEDIYLLDNKESYISVNDSVEKKISYSFQLAGDTRNLISASKALNNNENVMLNTTVVSCNRGFYMNDSQDSIEYDLLLKLNPATAENEVLYKTPDYKTRLLGFVDDSVILYDTVNHQIIKHTLTMNQIETNDSGSLIADSGAAETVLATIDSEGAESLVVEWCNHILFIYDESINADRRLVAIVRVD